MDQTTLRSLMIQRLNDSELRDLCFDLRVDYDNLGSLKNDRIRELIVSMERQGRLPELIEKFNQLQSQVTSPVQRRPTIPLVKASPEEERGLEELAKHLANADTETQAELATHAKSLRENRQAERRFGSNENNRSARSQIIFALNEFALTHCGVSFNELCRG